MDKVPLDMTSEKYLDPKLGGFQKANPCNSENLKSKLASKFSKKSYVLVTQDELQSSAYCVNNDRTAPESPNITTAPQDEQILESHPLNDVPTDAEQRTMDLEMQALNKQTRQKVKKTTPMPCYFVHDIKSDDYTFVSGAFDTTFHATSELVDTFQRVTDKKTKITTPAIVENYGWLDFSKAVTSLVVRYRLVLLRNYPNGLPLCVKHILASKICETFPSIESRYIELRNKHAHVVKDTKLGITESSFGKQYALAFVESRMSTQFKHNSKQPTINFGVARKNVERRMQNGVQSQNTNSSLPLPRGEQAADLCDIVDGYSSDLSDYGPQFDEENISESPQRQLQIDDKDIQGPPSPSTLATTSAPEDKSLPKSPLTTTVEVSLDQSSQSTKSTTIVDYPSSDDDTLPPIASFNLPQRSVLCSTPIENSLRKSNRIKNKMSNEEDVEVISKSSRKRAGAKNSSKLLMKKDLSKKKRV